jgi:hypothetical protein
MSPRRVWRSCSLKGEKRRERGEHSDVKLGAGTLQFSFSTFVRERIKAV